MLGTVSLLKTKSYISAKTLVECKECRPGETPQEVGGFFLSDWITTHQLCSFFEVFCALREPVSLKCHARVTLQSHRWHLVVGSERWGSPGMQKVFETMSLNLNCFLQAFRLHRWHCNKAGWFGMAEEINPKGRKKHLHLSTLYLQPVEKLHWQSCANKALRKWGTIV